MATKQILAVSETFYSIQGEGQTMGIPAVFLRLGGCNLLCESKSWICDTIEVWRKSKATPFENVLTKEQMKVLENGAHLVITGGEPLMHQKQITEFILWIINTHEFCPTIEIETNGTIIPNADLLRIVDYWNVSPKLSNAGEQNTEAMRIKADALQTFKSLEEKVIFKFVVENEDDVNEIMQKFINEPEQPHITLSQLVLMPAGSSQEELLKTRLFVAEKCRELQVRYSDRLHVVIWNQKTGV
jgi:7-carboxy-7-deazaguanine synthase